MMTKKLCLLLFSCIVLYSCFLFSRYKRTNFTYTEDGISYSIPIVVPKGYTKERTEVDSSGNTILSYSWGGKAWFYVAHLIDTSVKLQPINEEDHIPHMSHTTGALIFKGMDEENLYWREVRQNSIRTGYRNVPKSLESRFDSATNYAVVHPLKKERVN